MLLAQHRAEALRQLAGTAWRLREPEGIAQRAEAAARLILGDVPFSNLRPARASVGRQHRSLENLLQHLPGSRTAATQDRQAAT